MSDDFGRPPEPAKYHGVGFGNYEKLFDEVNREVDDLIRQVSSDNSKEKDQVAMLRNALFAVGIPKQFAPRPCYCQTASGIYCVGQPQCKQANEVLDKTCD